MDDKILLSIIGLILSVLTFFFGRISVHRAAGEKSGYIASDIGYIKAGIDDLKAELRAVKSEVAEMSTRLTRVEESDKHAHEKINELMQKG